MGGRMGGVGWSKGGESAPLSKCKWGKSATAALRREIVLGNLPEIKTCAK